MDGFTILVAFIIFIDLLLYMIRVVTIDPPVSPSDEGATEHKGDVPSPPTGAASLSAHENDDERFQFDAFLSFRGQDIRNRFVCHLYKDLKRSNVRAFMDNRDLGKGEPIENLLKHIRESRILLPIFSKNYADSIWCLKEVTEMMKVMKTDQSVDIVPIFFDVEPDDVRCWYRHSQGRFRSASADEKKKWRKALRKVTSIHGFTLRLRLMQRVKRIFSEKFVRAGEIPPARRNHHQTCSSSRVPFPLSPAALPRACLLSGALVVSLARPCPTNQGRSEQCFSGALVVSLAGNREHRRLLLLLIPFCQLLAIGHCRCQGNGRERSDEDKWTDQHSSFLDCFFFYYLFCLRDLYSLNFMYWMGHICYLVLVLNFVGSVLVKLSYRL